MKIAFLGLGAMGSRMAHNLLEAGFKLAIYNRSWERGQSLIEKGARWAASPREAVAQADVVFSMVSDDQASRNIWLGEQGALAALTEGQTAIECSTLSPSWIRELAIKMDERNAHFIDAPLLGSRPQAEEKQLIFLAGGTKEYIEQCDPLFKAMGSKIFLLGPTGSGAMAKLAINAIFAAEIAVMAEGFKMLQRAGMGTALQDVLPELPIMSPAMKGVFALMMKGDHAPRFPIDLVEKDLRYFLESLKDSSSAPLIRCAHDIFRKAQISGQGGQNISGILNYYS